MTRGSRLLARGDAATHPSAMPSDILVAELPELSVLRVAGPDRIAWLQGQVTNDVYAQGTLHAFRLDAQGKIEAEIRGVDDGEALLLVTESNAIDALAKSLDRRIVAEDVEVSVARSLAVVGAYGGSISTSALDAPSVASRRFGIPGREFLVDSAAKHDALAALVRATNGRPATARELESTRVREGYPRFGVDYEGVLPQETGLARSTVSFSKGCYLGQEPVVMLEHRGKPPRRACVVLGPETLTPPFDLARADGTIVGRCATYEAGRGIALVKRSDAIEGTELVAQGATVRISRLVDEGPA